MPTKDSGAVCDTSVLKDRLSLNGAQRFFHCFGLYIPSSTYSWLSRSKLIQVRNQTVKYSLLKQMVRRRSIYPIHLPELYDEIGRQIMFETNHKVALTDLRGLLLAAHLQLPILTYDDNLLGRISDRIGTKIIKRFEADSNWLNIRELLNLYREISFRSGKEFLEQLENGLDFEDTVKEIKNSSRKNIKTSTKSMKQVNDNNGDSEKLEFKYVAWDILPSLHEYYKQKIFQKEIFRQACERSIILMAKPTDSKENSQK